MFKWEKSHVLVSDEKAYCALKVGKNIIDLFLLYPLVFLH